MIEAIKIRLYPTKEQERLMNQTSGNVRYAWNWAIAYLEEAYKSSEKVDPIAARKIFTQHKKEIGFEWLNKVSGDGTNEVFNDLKKAYDKFYTNLKKGLPVNEAGKPKFKKKSNSKKSFYQDARKTKVMDKKVWLVKIGWVKIKDEGRLPVGDYKKEKISVSNIRISYDNKGWYLSCGIERKREIPQLNDLSIGIDLGIKELATCSDGKEFTVKNINKSKEVKRLEKKHKRLSRQISRKYEMNKQGNKFMKTNNIYKLEKRRKLLDRRLTNIRNNHTHQATNAIIKRKPSKIVVEDLNIKGMMKNRHLAKSVANQKFYEFRRQLAYKAKSRLGIELTIADRWFPSSKMCSQCGAIKQDLKLSNRVYKCDCGLIIDRDFNASINLANYSI
jgi:putative transposase